MHHAASARARWLSTARRPVLAGCSVALLVSGAALATSAFGKETEYPSGYAQRIALTYTAQATGDVYDRDRIRTGEPVLLRLAKRLDVVVAYAVSGEELSTVRGTLGLTGRVSSEGGWQRTVQLQAPQAFAAAETRTEVRVDLTPMVALARDVQRLGGPATGYRIDLVPQVRTNAAVGDRMERLAMAPTVRFRLVGESLELESQPAAAGQPVVVTTTSPGPHGTVRMGPSWWRTEVGTARLLAAALLVLGLAALLGAALRPARPEEVADGPAAPTARPRGDGAVRLQTERAMPVPAAPSFDTLMEEQLTAGADQPELPAREGSGGRLARREDVPSLVVVSAAGEDEDLTEEELYAALGAYADDAYAEPAAQQESEESEEPEEVEDDLPEPDDEVAADERPARLDLGPLDFSQDDLVFPEPYAPRAADDADEDPVEDEAPEPAAEEQPTAEEAPIDEPVIPPDDPYERDEEFAPAQPPVEALLDRYFPERTEEPADAESEDAQPGRGRRRAAGPPDAPAVPRQRQAEHDTVDDEPADDDVDDEPEEETATLLDQGTPRPDLSPTPAPDRRPSAGRHRSEAAGAAPRIPRQAHRHRSDHPVT